MKDSRRGNRVDFEPTNSLYTYFKDIVFAYIDEAKSVGDCLCEIQIPDKVPPYIVIDLATRLCCRRYGIDLIDNKMTVYWNTGYVNYNDSNWKKWMLEW